MLCERVEKAGFWTCAGNMSKAVDILLALRDFVYGAVWKSLQIDSFCGAIPVLRHLRAGEKFDCGSYPLRVFFAGFAPSCGSRRGLLVIAAL